MTTMWSIRCPLCPRLSVCDTADAALANNNGTDRPATPTVTSLRKRMSHLHPLAANEHEPRWRQRQVAQYVKARTSSSRRRVVVARGAADCWVDGARSGVG